MYVCAVDGHAQTQQHSYLTRRSRLKLSANQSFANPAYLHHHNLFNILHVFARKIKIDKANKTYKHTNYYIMIKNYYTRVI